jgi:hypothetical protein
LQPQLMDGDEAYLNLHRLNHPAAGFCFIYQPSKGGEVVGSNLGPAFSAIRTYFVTI